MVCDNLATHKTPAVNEWIARHPRFHVHFTPTGSSWINQVERWFAYLTTQMLQRGVHKSVQALEAGVRDWVQQWNDNPRPFVWKRPPKKSSTHSPDICNEFQADNTRPAARITPARASTRPLPHRVISRAATGDRTSMSTPLGSRHRPATSTEEPKP